LRGVAREPVSAGVIAGGRAHSPVKEPAEGHPGNYGLPISTEDATIPA
jgi:hypothetical protein